MVWITSFSSRGDDSAARLRVTRDRTAFNQAVGQAQLAGSIHGGLQADGGETSGLLKPATLPATNQIVVDRVRYEATSPWPAPTNGSALQLRDASQTTVALPTGPWCNRQSRRHRIWCCWITPAWRFMRSVKSGRRELVSLGVQ